MRSAMPTLAATAVALCLLAAPGHAQTSAAPAAPAPVPPAAAPATVPRLDIRTLRDLVSLCQTPDSDPNYAARISLCVGYGSGVLDYHLLDTSGAPGRRPPRARRVCLPTPYPTRSEALSQFNTWAVANQQYMDTSAVNGVMRFLIATYPCTGSTVKNR